MIILDGYNMNNSTQNYKELSATSDVLKVYNDPTHLIGFLVNYNDHGNIYNIHATLYNCNYDRLKRNNLLDNLKVVIIDRFKDYMSGEGKDLNNLISC